MAPSARFASVFVLAFGFGALAACGDDAAAPAPAGKAGSGNTSGAGGSAAGASGSASGTGGSASGTGGSGGSASGAGGSASGAAGGGGTMGPGGGAGVIGMQDPPTAADYATVDAFIDALAKRRCGHARDCCFVDGFSGQPEAECIAEEKAGLGKLTPAGYTYDPVFGQICLESTAKQSCLNEDPNETTFVSCGRSFRGPNYDKGALGDKCAISSDCKVAAGADFTGCFSDGTDLRCQADKTLAVGAPCSESGGSPTEIGNFCDYETAECKGAVCVARKPAGAACDPAGDFNQCVEGASCGESKVCERRPTQGDACIDDAGCGASSFYVCTKGVCASKKQTDDLLAPRHCVVAP